MRKQKLREGSDARIYAELIQAVARKGMAPSLAGSISFPYSMLTPKGITLKMVVNLLKKNKSGRIIPSATCDYF